MSKAGDAQLPLVRELDFDSPNRSRNNRKYKEVREREYLYEHEVEAMLKAARARGKKGGRKRALTDKQISIGKSLAADKSRSISDICQTLKISPATYYRYIHQ